MSILDKAQLALLEGFSSPQTILILELVEIYGPAVWQVLQIFLNKTADPSSAERQAFLDEARAARDRWNAAKAD